MLTTGYVLLTAYKAYEVVQTKCISRCIILSTFRILSAEQLQYIPKVILLRMCGDYIDHVWDKLPGSGSGDSNLSSLRRAQSVMTADAHRRSGTEDNKL